MEPRTVLLISVPAILILAVLLVVATTASRGRQPDGSLGREARRTDRSATATPLAHPDLNEYARVRFEKCPPLGCRVPWCQTSQWFECPCHGSKYNRVGEKKGGPAPRGMDRFPVDVSPDGIVINTGIVVQGPPIGTNTSGQEAEGP